MQHKIFHGIWNTAILTWMYYGVFRFFTLWTKHSTALVGVFVLQALVPLSISGYYMEENFFQLGGVAWMLFAFYKQRWVLLYIGMCILSIHREQSLMIPIWITLSMLHLTAQNKNWLRISGLFIIWCAIFMGLRWIRGVHYTPYSMEFHLSYNLDKYHFTHYIAPLWLGQVILPLLLAATQWHKLKPPFKSWLISLIPYYFLFLVFGKWTELDKAMSGYLFMIPPALTWIQEKRSNFRV